MRKSRLMKIITLVILFVFGVQQVGFSKKTDLARQSKVTLVDALLTIGKGYFMRAGVNKPGITALNVGVRLYTPIVTSLALDKMKVENRYVRAAIQTGVSLGVNAYLDYRAPTEAVAKAVAAEVAAEVATKATARAVVQANVGFFQGCGIGIKNWFSDGWQWIKGCFSGKGLGEKMGFDVTKDALDKIGLARKLACQKMIEGAFYGAGREYLYVLSFDHLFKNLREDYREQVSSFISSVTMDISTQAVSCGLSRSTGLVEEYDKEGNLRAKDYDYKDKYDKNGKKRPKDSKDFKTAGEKAELKAELNNVVDKQWQKFLPGFVMRTTGGAIDGYAAARGWKEEGVLVSAGLTKMYNVFCNQNKYVEGESKGGKKYKEMRSDELKEEQEEVNNMKISSKKEQEIKKAEEAKKTGKPSEGLSPSQSEKAENKEKKDLLKEKDQRSAALDVYWKKEVARENLNNVIEGNLVLKDSKGENIPKDKAIKACEALIAQKKYQIAQMGQGLFGAALSGLASGAISLGLQRFSNKNFDDPLTGAQMSLLVSSVLKTAVSDFGATSKSPSLFVAKLGADIASVSCDGESVGKFRAETDDKGRIYTRVNPNDIVFLARLYDYNKSVEKSIKDIRKGEEKGGEKGKNFVDTLVNLGTSVVTSISTARMAKQMALTNQQISSLHGQAVSNVKDTLSHGLYTTRKYFNSNTNAASPLIESLERRKPLTLKERIQITKNINLGLRQMEENLIKNYAVETKQTKDGKKIDDKKLKNQFEALSAELKDAKGDGAKIIEEKINAIQDYIAVKESVNSRGPLPQGVIDELSVVGGVPGQLAVGPVGSWVQGVRLPGFGFEDTKLELAIKRLEEKEEKLSPDEITEKTKTTAMLTSLRRIQDNTRYAEPISQFKVIEGEYSAGDSEKFNPEYFKEQSAQKIKEEAKEFEINKKLNSVGFQEKLGEDLANANKKGDDLREAYVTARKDKRDKLIQEYDGQVLKSVKVYRGLVGQQLSYKSEWEKKLAPVPPPENLVTSTRIVTVPPVPPPPSVKPPEFIAAPATTIKISKQVIVDTLRVNFDLNKKDVTEQSQVSALVDFAQKIKNDSDTKIILYGRADSRGSDKYNKELSQDRAEAVRDELVKLGVDPSRISIIPLGKTEAKGTDRKSYAADRNVTCSIVKEIIREYEVPATGPYATPPREQISSKSYEGRLIEESKKNVQSGSPGKASQTKPSGSAGQKKVRTDSSGKTFNQAFGAAKNAGLHKFTWDGNPYVVR